ncbi:uncharacterized protein EI97DRAFT_439244 [Westerdykella ornata]|uniref:Uncharacterized protein n=1 Tax=Westerdykella ornata TaxID=318751 RepID=A0A6A6JWJ7_WESOR|nr:uncharacterized protein EI97DRAFT_439244 [Westerdykella ornata]KAF2280188.1 hypothetical protein EI97DRAFT_439244 [Westerdykella ornata]
MSEVSFADFVKESREKKKREALAQEILGSRGRKAGAGALPNTRNGAQKPSLVSRMSSSSGVNKSRSSSAKPAANIEGKWQHDLHDAGNHQGPPKKPYRAASASQIDRNTRTFNKFRSVLQDNVSGSDSSGFNIKGVATGGPFTVIASNFAIGTTAADIEAVMVPIANERDGTVLSCRLISAKPTVMVELTVDKRDAAQNIVDMFNNKKACPSNRADGRLLYVYIKESTGAAPQQRPAARLTQSFDDMEVDNTSSARNGSYQDGRFGFSENGYREPPRGPRRRY